MEEFHWLPQDIAKIPYKKLQKIFALRKEKNQVNILKENTEKFKRSVASGRRVIEV